MAASSSSPLVAYSTDGSLIGIHHPDSSSSAKNGLIRCYDGNISNGSLKFTLRFPLHNQNNSNLPDGLPSLSSDKANNNNNLRKLIFASSNNKPTYLCGMTSNNTILLFNIERGVLSSTINITSANNNKKKKRKLSLSQGTGNEILVDVVASSTNNSLYALAYFPTNDVDSSSNTSGGKCRLYQYTLTDNDEPTLIKKIKVGSVSGSNGEGGNKLVFGLGISKSNIVIRLNNQVRVVDLGSGDKLCKLELPSGNGVSNNNSDEGEDEVTSFVPLAVTNDGRYIVTSSSSSGGNQAMVLSYANQDTEHSLSSLAMLSTKDNEESISNFDITQLDNNDDELAIVAFQSNIGTSSLFNISTSNDDDNTDSSTLTLPKATLQTNELDKHLSLIGSTFNPRKPTKSLTLLFNQGKKHVGAGSAGTGTNLPMESLPFNDSKLEGNVLVGTSLSTVDEKGNNLKDKKRKGKVHDNVALAPGDQGLEASTAMDLSQGQAVKKKARVSSAEEEGAVADDDEDDFGLGDDDDDEEGENGQSIAERLALLSSAMEQSDDDTDSDDEEESSSTKQVKPFKLKSATSETLTTLLTQALTSNDSSQLNIALQVTDRRLVEGTVRALQSLDAERRASQLSATETLANHPGYVSMLMAHIVRRMARRHTLVNVLGVWVKAILAATARSTSYQGGGGSGSVEEQIMANEGREMALKLGPLKNFLNERVECFPQLLRLEGRLSLLNQQF